MDKTYSTLILAGLLHDIGKLLNKPRPEKGKRHAVYGEELLRSEPYAGLLQADKFADALDFDLLRYLVLRHDPHVDTEWHVPGYTKLLRCMRLADGLSAGERSLDRVYGEEAKGHRALDSIFAPLYLGRPIPSGESKYYPRPLSPDAVFPTADIEPLTENDYRPTIDAFKAGFRYALEHAGTWRELEAWIYSLLERYTWAVPSAVHLEPRDVSLFDHSRTSCALAAAIYLYRYSGQKRARRTFVLIKGDVSGVQDYVYSVTNIGPGGAAKRLRARSFFVTALTEVVSHRLLDELVPDYRLPIAAKIFAGGGQFVLLAPNLEVVHENLARIEREVNEWLWQQFQGDLAVVLGKVELGQREVAIRPGGRRNICQVLDELEREVQIAKAHRLGALLKDESGWRPEAFVWEAKPYPYGDCPSCRRLPARAPDEPGVPIDDRLCQRCYDDRVLSEQIVKAKYIAYYHEPCLEADDPEWLRRRLLTFFEGEKARQVVLLEQLDDQKRISARPYQLDGFGYETPTPKGPALVRHFANYVPRFNNWDALISFCTEDRRCVHGLYSDDERCGILVRPDGSRVRPDNFPIPRTFGCISAAAAEHEDGFLGSQLLGVLRADVDHLGWLFHEGIGEVKSLSRLATLSRMTDLFFAGWVNEILRCPPPGKRFDLIYTVYSGGDDLCLVGPWDVLIDFTRYLADRFADYVAGNPNVTLSAAITVTKPKFPIAASARQAGEWLKERAKGQGRNRLHLFGVTARWRDVPDYEDLNPELAQQLSELERFSRLTVDDLWHWAEFMDGELRRWREEGRGRYPVSTAFAHRLLDYAEMARRWEEEERIDAENLLYLARLAYDLGRNVAESDAVPPATKQDLARLTQLSNREVMARLRLPITWALLRNRERRGI